MAVMFDSGFGPVWWCVLVPDVVVDFVGGGGGGFYGFCSRW